MKICRLTVGEYYIDHQYNFKSKDAAKVDLRHSASPEQNSYEHWQIC